MGQPNYVGPPGVHLSGWVLRVSGCGKREPVRGDDSRRIRREINGWGSSSSKATGVIGAEPSCGGEGRWGLTGGEVAVGVAGK